MAVSAPYWHPLRPVGTMIMWALPIGLLLCANTLLYMPSQYRDNYGYTVESPSMQQGCRRVQAASIQVLHISGTVSRPITFEKDGITFIKRKIQSFKSCCAEEGVRVDEVATTEGPQEDDVMCHWAHLAHP